MLKWPKKNQGIKKNFTKASQGKNIKEIKAN